MRIPTSKIKRKKNSVMQWQTQASKITTNNRVKVYLTLTEFSVMKIVAWNCHVDDSTKISYNIILARYLLNELV